MKIRGGERREEPEGESLGRGFGWMNAALGLAKVPEILTGIELKAFE